MKVLLIKQLFAELIVSGKKTVKNKGNLGFWELKTK